MPQTESKAEELREQVATILPPTLFKQLQWHWVNPDENLAIETVRDLTQELAYSSPAGSIRTYVLDRLESASLPAQQALLKMVEEPPAQTLLILVTSDLNQVLPTLKSRSRLLTTTALDLTETEKTAITEVYQSLLSGGIAVAIDQAESFGSDKPTAKKVVSQLITYLHTLPATPATIGHQQALLAAYQQLTTNASPKLILEGCFFKIVKVS